MDKEKIEKHFIEDCEDDYVGLWYLVREFIDCNDNQYSESIKIDTLSLLEKLLDNDKIIAGNPNSLGEFIPFIGTSSEIIRKIKKEWDILGREPDIGEIIWFTIRDNER